MQIGGIIMEKRIIIYILIKRKIKVEQLSEIERFLYESYRKIDVDFTFNEVTTLKLKLTDDKFYFHTDFSFLLFF
jgi:hypothetical protein